MDDVVEFFKEKRSWSKYKDLILDYYIKPYLPKVATLGKPVIVVDCFAGPGLFRDGSRGSPLIIADHLKTLHEKGKDVRGIFIESDKTLYEQLKANLAAYSFPITIYGSDFHDHIDELANLASDNTVFIYADPILPSHLNFFDLADIYEKVRQGRSIETLINFLSTGFVRRAQGVSSRASINGILDKTHHEVVRCNDIVGSEFWQQIVFDTNSPQRDKIDAVAEKYAAHLRKWFRWVLSYPIREKYEDEQPKYHLVFGSRHHDAVDLMNRAMVTARREFVGNFFVKGLLFPIQPKAEEIDPVKIETAIIDTLSRLKECTWEQLRVETTVRYPCLYLDSELNQAIKRAISKGRVRSSADGNKIEQKAIIKAIK